MPANVVDGEKATMASGVATKPLYIKHVALQDWESLKKIQAMIGGKTVADAIRYAIRRTSGAVGQ